MKAIEKNFPFEEIDPVAEKESYRKEVNRPIYHTHKWWAQRLGSVFRAITLGAILPTDRVIWTEFYKKHSFNDFLILDPFMGSGTTVGEAIKLGCKTIGCDINPVSTYIVSQAFNNIPSVKLIETFSTISDKVKSKINYYYTKRHPITGELCQVLYYFWVKVVVTPEGKQLPLFSNYVFSKNAYTKKKPLSQIICPKCWAITQERFDLDSLVCPSCSQEFNPQKGPVEGQYITDEESGIKYKILDLVKLSKKPPQHKLYASMVVNKKGDKEYLQADELDEQLLQDAKLELSKLSFPFPEGVIAPGHNAKQVLSYNYTKWSEFFNERQLLCLGYLFQAILEIDDEKIKDAFICLFSGILEFNNMFCSFKGEGTGAVRHLFSNHILKPERTPLENSVWGNDKSSGTFHSLFRSRMLKAQEYRENPFELKAKNISDNSEKIYCSNRINANYVGSFEELQYTDGGCLILNGDSSRLPIPDAVVDAIVTDPPYFDFVHYSELSDFFFAWLKPAIKDRYRYFETPTSRRVGEVQQKKGEDFSAALRSVFAEGKRVLKDEGLLIFSFHHSRFEGWLSIYGAIIKAKLHIQTVYPVKAEMSVSSPKTSAADPINLDALFVCKKIENWVPSELSLEEIKSRAIDEALYLKGRFANVKRNLSKGDIKVILISLLLKYCSHAGHKVESVGEELDNKGIENLIEQVWECDFQTI